jgi:hypothetical protein
VEDVKPAGSSVFVEENIGCPGKLAEPGKSCTFEVKFAAGNEAKGRYTARLVAKYEIESGVKTDSSSFLEGEITN